MGRNLLANLKLGNNNNNKKEDIHRSIFGEIYSKTLAGTVVEPSVLSKSINLGLCVLQLDVVFVCFLVLINSSKAQYTCYLVSGLLQLCVIQ